MQKGFSTTSLGSFGSPATSNNLGFGKPTTTGQPSSGTGFSFGSPSASAGFGSGIGTTSGFGGSTSTTPSFGATNTSSFGAAPSSSFGVAAPSFGAFGTAGGTGTQTGTAFGSGTPSAFGSGFGANPTLNAAPSQFGSSFGTAMGGFGTGLGQTGVNTAAQSNPYGGFGAPFGTAAPFGAQQQQQQQLNDQWPGSDKLSELECAYAPIIDTQTGQLIGAPIPGRNFVANEAACKFDTIMYTPSNGVNYQQQTNTGTRWELAERDNPDPATLVPVRELGIDSLKKRFSAQTTESAKLKAHSANLRGIVDSIDKSSKQTALKLEALRAKQALLYFRMLAAVRSVEVLRCHGVAIDADERRYRERLERLYAAMREPHLKVQELMSIQTERQVEVYDEKVSEEDLETICAVLKKEREGLQHLTETLKRDIRDVNIFKQKMKPHHSQITMH